MPGNHKLPTLEGSIIPVGAKLAVETQHSGDWNPKWPCLVALQSQWVLPCCDWAPTLSSRAWKDDIVPLASYKGV